MDGHVLAEDRRKRAARSQRHAFLCGCVIQVAAKDTGHESPVLALVVRSDPEAAVESKRICKGGALSESREAAGGLFVQRVGRLELADADLPACAVGGKVDIGVGCRDIAGFIGFKFELEGHDA